MGKLLLRPYAPKDLGGVLSLYTKVFGAQAKQAFEAREAFSRLRNLAPIETGAWVLEREADGAVMGFIAGLPMPYRVFGERFFACTTADFMVDPAAGFHGVSLMREAFKRFPRQISIDDIAGTKALMGLMKARPVGELIRWAKPLDLRLLKGRRAWADRVPESLLAATRPVLRAVDRVRRPAGLEAVVELSFDERFDRFAAAYCGLESASVYRDLAWYRWRYGPDSPQRHAKVLALLDARGELEAYTVVAATPSSAWVLELCGKPGTDAARWMSLLVGAIRVARQSGAQALYAPVLEGSPRLELALTELGFLQREHRSVVYVRPAPDDAEPLRSRLLSGPWNIQFGDAEQSHGAVLQP